MSVAEQSGGSAAVIVDTSAGADNDAASYINWPAIIAGAIIASAVSFILLTFGSAIGLSMTSAEEGESASLVWIAIVGGLWILWVQLMASLAGGYLTGRMRRRCGGDRLVWHPGSGKCRGPDGRSRGKRGRAGGGRIGSHRDAARSDATRPGGCAADERRRPPVDNAHPGVRGHERARPRPGRSGISCRNRRRACRDSA